MILILMSTPFGLSTHYRFSSLDTFISGSVDRRLASLWSQRVALFLTLALAVSTSTYVIEFQSQISSKPIVILWQNSEAILLRLNQTQEVTLLASTFLKITALGLPAFAFNEIMK